MGKFKDSLQDKTLLLLTSLLFALIILYPGSCFAQSEVELINPDRPDQNESPDVIEPLVLQVESGYIFEKTADLDIYKETNQSIPQVLIRFGLLKNIEFRTYLEYGVTKEELHSTVTGEYSDYTHNGFKPAKFGVKLKIYDGEGFIPSAAFLINLAIPKLASSYYKADYIAPEIILSLEQNLSKKISVGYNIIMSWDGFSPESNEAYSISANYSISRRIGMFLETYGFYQGSSSADNRLDGGLYYLINKDLQVDASGGVGLNDISPKFFLGAGFSFRLPALKK
ncbi:MAG: transporter [Ignavibacteria bacterium]|jgi:hypothetical protein